MSRSLPPYQTPQSNSPSSQHSPQTHQYVAPTYGAHYQHSQAYGNFTQAPQYPFPQPYQPNFLTHYAYPPARQSVTPQSPQVFEPGPIERQSSFTASTPILTSNPVLGNSAPAPVRPISSSASSTLPGPIKATVPIVVKKDIGGVVWIRFDYTKDRVRKSYDIRCDVDTVDLEALPEDFKKRNVVYPRAFKGERYTRLKYETECNETAWALVKLNPELDGHKGLRQRAVDSWRNSNVDRTKASRRVRRDAKKQIRNEQAQKALRKPDDVRAAQELPRMQYAPAVSASSYISAASTNRHWNSDIAQYSDGTSYDTSFMSPTGRNLPPTPDTMTNGSKRGSSAGSNNFDHGHGHGHYKGGLSIERREDTFRYELPSDNKHTSPDATMKTDVYPRASKRLGEYSSSDYNYTRTQVRVGEGFGYDKILTVPAMSEVRASRDRTWNERGYALSHDLARNGLADLAGRPQALQQALTRTYRNSGELYQRSKPFAPSSRPGRHP